LNRSDIDLYVIADPEWVKGDIIDATLKAIRGGVKWIQIRGKNIPPRQLISIFESIASTAREHACKIFINDRIDLAIILNAEGIHLGQNSIPLSRARKLAGNHFIIGVSTHSLEEAKEAEREGADFITFGPIFETESKRKYGPPLGIDRLREVVRNIHIPVLAIGGINHKNVEQVLQAGAHGIAVISAVLNAPAPDMAAASMLKKVKSIKRSISTQFL